MKSLPCFGLTSSGTGFASLIVPFGNSVVDTSWMLTFFLRNSVGQHVGYAHLQIPT